MSRVGEAIRYAYNPLPEISDKDVLDRAELRRPARDIKPTEFRWKMWIDNDQRFFLLKPGDSIPLRGVEGEVFLKEFGDRGGVLLDNPTDDDEVQEAKVTALSKAAQFYQDRGLTRVDDYQNRHGLDGSQIERRKHGDLWQYFYNQALADIFMDELTAPSED